MDGVLVGASTGLDADGQLVGAGWSMDGDSYTIRYFPQGGEAQAPAVDADLGDGPFTLGTSTERFTLAIARVAPKGGTRLLGEAAAALPGRSPVPSEARLGRSPSPAEGRSSSRGEAPSAAPTGCARRLLKG
jgi:hypothetical protein